MSRKRATHNSLKIVIHCCLISSPFLGAMLTLLLPLLGLTVGGFILVLVVGSYSEPSAPGVTCREESCVESHLNLLHMVPFTDVSYYFCVIFVTPKASFVKLQSE